MRPSDPLHNKNRHWASSFRIRNYRHQWFSDLLGSWGMEMEVLILGWFVLVQTESPLLLSILGALHFGGTLLCPLSGVIADRISRRTILIGLRLIYALLASFIMVLGLLDLIEVWHLFIIAGLSGLLKPTDLVIRNALVADIVPEETLRNALGYARTTMDLARIIGSLLGAGLFALLGLGIAYGAVVGIYLVSALLAARIDLPAQEFKTKSRPLKELQQAWRYLKSHSMIVATLILAFLVNVTAFPITHGLLPVVVKNIYGMQEHGLATMLTLFSIGALVGGFVSAVLRNVERIARGMIIAILIWHASIALLGQTTVVAIGFGLMLVIGVSHGIAMVLMSAVLLYLTDESYRGRMSGIRMMLIYGLPLGLVMGGWLIERLGVVSTFTLYGLVGAACTILVTLRWPILWKNTDWSKL